MPKYWEISLSTNAHRIWLLNTFYTFNFCCSFQLVIAMEYEELLLNVFHHFQKTEEPCTNDANLQNSKCPNTGI